MLSTPVLGTPESLKPSREAGCGVGALGRAVLA